MKKACTSNPMRLALTGGLLILLTGCGEKTGSGISDGGIKLSQTEFRDPMRGNRVAERILVPDGWEIEGGIQRPSPALTMIPVFTDITITAPDKRGVRFFGILEFGYADGVRLPLLTPYKGRPFFYMPQSLGDFWLQLADQNPAPGVRNLRIVSEEVMPEATEFVQKQAAPFYQSVKQENTQLAYSGQQKFFHTEARKLVVGYEYEGTEIEAVVFAVLQHTVYRQQNGFIRAGMWTLNNMYAMFAPVGTEPTTEPVLVAIVQSRQKDPEWMAAIERDYMRIGQQIVAEGQAKIAAANRASARTKIQQSDDVLDISFQGWKNRSAMRDAGQAKTVNAILEQTTYATPAGNTVNLPSYYQNVYTDGQGGYVLHNNANYNINTDPNFNSRDWKKVRPIR